MKRELIYAWSSFLGSYFSLIAIDYILRSTDGDIKLGGINFFILWLLWFPFLCVSLYFLLSASRKFKANLSRAFFLLSNFLVAIFIALAISLFYTVGLEIDSL